jgi:chromosome segregation ATPase
LICADSRCRFQKAQEEIDNIQAQGHASTAHLSGLQANCKPHVERKDDIKRMLIQRDAIRQSQMQVLEIHTATKTEKEFALEQWRKKSDKHKQELERVEAELTSWGDRMQVAMDRAAEICPREEVDTSKARSIKKLEHNINALEKALREKEARLGGSSEEVYKRYIRAKHNYDENVTGIRDLSSCAEVRA